MTSPCIICVAITGFGAADPDRPMRSDNAGGAGHRRGPHAGRVESTHAAFDAGGGRARAIARCHVRLDLGKDGTAQLR